MLDNLDSAASMDSDSTPSLGDKDNDHVLSIAKINPYWTVIHDHQIRPAYFMVTETSWRKRTVVRNASKQEIAVIKWHKTSDDLLLLGRDNKSVLKEYLKQRKGRVGEK